MVHTLNNLDVREREWDSLEKNGVDGGLELDDMCKRKGLMIVEGKVGENVTDNSRIYILDSENKMVPILGKSRLKQYHMLKKMVMANRDQFKCQTHWHRGKITRKHTDGTFDICSELSGDDDHRVRPNLIKDQGTEVGMVVQYQKGEWRGEATYSVVKGIMDDQWMQEPTLETSAVSVLS